MKSILALLASTLLWLALGAPALAQNFTISGYLKDAASGEELIGATVTVKERPGTGTTTNLYGFYSLTLPKGSYTLIYTYVGYESIEEAITLDQSMKINKELAESQMRLEEVVVSASRPEENVTDVKMSVEKLSIEKIKSIPALFGEVDVIRTIQFLPGVQSAGEGTTGLFVRGGGADQNLIQLDGAPVYNASHLLGFFSVFNPDAVKNVELYKGGIPAQFGGRLSSILDIQMKEGNKKNFVASGGLGTISSRLTAEGPIVQDKGSFLITGRRTYADVFLRLSNNPNINSNILYFYDLNAKANYEINENNRIFLSGYFGRDVFKFQDQFGLDWGNSTATLRWNHLFNDKLFLNSMAIYSEYQYGFDVDVEPVRFLWSAGLKEYNTKFDFTWFANPNNTVTFGANGILHEFTPANIEPKDDDSFIDAFTLDSKFAVEQAYYIGNDHKISEKLSMSYGLRYSLFQHVGPGQVFTYQEGLPFSDETITDTVSYARGENIKLYHGAEPRFGMRYLLTPSSSVKLSYNRMRQYLQIASNATAGLPIDRWIPADNYIAPLIGDQVAVGYFRNFFDNQLEFSAEGYYKWMQNLIDFSFDADILLNNNVETEIFTGKGWAYGAEFMLKKSTGNTTGWVSYTLSRTWRQIDSINGGNPYLARYDRTHDVSVILSHQFTPRLNVAATWVYATGNAVSFPVGIYNIGGNYIPEYDDTNRNADRMPAFHRADLSVTYDGRETARWKSSWNFSVYNVYNRKNTFSYEFREVINGKPQYDPEQHGPPVTSEPSIVRTYLFPILPSITYNFTFK